jgi:hypothetical protein
MTYQVLEMSLSTTVGSLDEHTGKSISDVLSTVIRINQVPQTWTTTSSSALHAEFRETVCKSLLSKKGLQ